MAIKTTIGPKGVVSENTTGTEDILVVNVDTERNIVTNLSGSTGVVSVKAGTTMFHDRGAVVTASLPALTTASEGAEVLLLLDSQGNNVLQVTGSSGAVSIDGSDVANVSGSYGHLRLVGVRDNDTPDLLWHILDQKPAL